MSKFVRNSNVNEAKLMQVIAIESIAGDGTEEHPYHAVYEYFSTDGELLARTDSMTTNLEQGRME